MKSNRSVTVIFPVEEVTGSKFFLPPKNSEKDRRHFPNSYALSLDRFLILLPGIRSYELVMKGLSNGTHRVARKYVEVSYWCKSKKVIVRYAKNGGKISDAWVVK